MLGDALPSVKHSLALEYDLFSFGKLTRLSGEVAVPMMTGSGGDTSRIANFLKLEVRHQQRWNLVADKINAVCDF